MNQIERIEHFEKILDETTAAVDNLSDALEKYSEIQEKYFELMRYYGGEWRQDYEDDEAGKIPKDLKRGVLSQDAVYDLLMKNRSLQVKILEIFADILRKG